ncbi:MAG: TIR domain-containing protein [Oscillospiraceae bacterium]|nr:TIR domain-containing protein [Oscillospiraceae bacterium]
MSYLTPYEGDQPYIFISYAHANSPAVMEVVQELSDQGYRIWYDEGIEVGSEWPEYIAKHLASAGLMIAFLSNAYMRSDNCRREMHYALSKRIPIVNIFLEETQMTPGMEMQVGNLFALMKYTMNDDVFYDKLFAAPQLDPLLQSDGERKDRRRQRPQKRKKVPVDLTVEARKKKKRKVRRIVRLSILLLALVACVTLGIIAYSTGLAQRLFIKRQQTMPEALPDDTVVQLENPILEQAAREYASIEEGELHVGDLAGLTELFISGDRYSFSEPEEASGTEGGIESLNDLRYFTDLDKLSLTAQPLRSLESLPLCGIEYLDLSGCKVTSLKGVANLPNLREICTDGCPLRDLGDLQYCLQLRRISLLGANITDFSALKPLTRLAEIAVSNCGINQLRVPMRLSSLTDVTFYDCDLRGSFFKAFDNEYDIVSLSLIDCKLNSTENLGDFTGLTTLRLERTGENLDWSGLAKLPALKTVYANESMEAVLRPVLEGTAVTLVPAEEP